MSAAVALVIGVLLGVALMAGVRVRPEESPCDVYREWLGRECWVRPCSRIAWRRCVVVAVSWRGAVCVRDADRVHEDSGRWIKKQSVGWRVRWDAPEGEAK